MSVSMTPEGVEVLTALHRHSTGFRRLSWKFCVGPVGIEPTTYRL